MATLEEVETALAGAQVRIKELNDESKGHRLNATNARAELEAAKAELATAGTTHAAALAAALKEQGDKVIAAEAKVTEATKRASDSARDAALRIAAKDAGIVDMDGLKLLDTSKVTVADDGVVTIPDKFFEDAKAAKPYLFGANGSTNGNTSNTGRTPNPDIGGKNALTMTDAEYAVARAALGLR